MNNSLIQLQQKRRSIFASLFVSFISSSLLIILMTGFFYYEYTSQSTEKRGNAQVEYSLQESVALFEAGYQSPLQSNLKILESAPSLNNFLSFQKDQAALVRFDIEKQFTQLIRSRPEFYRSIRFVDAFGMEQVVVEGRKRRRLYQSIKVDSPLSVLQERLKKTFEQLQSGATRQVVFSQPFKTTAGRFLFYAAIAKLEPEIGGFGGAVFIECDLSPYINSLASIRSDGYPIAWLLNANGEVLVKPSAGIPQRDPRLETSILSQIPKSGIARSDLFPTQSFGKAPFLTLVLSIPTEIFHRQNLNILNSTLFIALLAISFTLLVAWLVARKITRPVIELVEVSQQIAGGDYTTRSVLQDNSEIGELSRSFNYMAETLEQSMLRLNQELVHRRSAENELQQSHESLQLILNSTAEGIFGMDVEGKITFCNASALTLLGYENEQELVGQDVQASIQYCDAHTQAQSQPSSTLKCSILAALQKELTVYADNEVFRRTDKTFFPVEYRAHQVKQNGKVIAAVVSFSDISRRKKQEKKIIYQAHYDMLTAIPNRFLAMDRLEQLIDNAKRHNRMAAVMFIDLDGFKKVNDMLGHDMGDKLLVESAQRLQNCIRKEDTVGRLGGDEFIVLLADMTTQLDAGLVAETILATFREPFEIGEHELLLTASIGIAVFPDDSENAMELLRHADIAMYESKQSGRNTYRFFTEELNTGIQRHLELEEHLHHALHRNELYLVYQPIVDIQTMDISGAEVLLRWNSAKLGAIGPDEFIPIAEHAGLISAIGDFVLRGSIAQAAKWRKEYKPDFKLSVNVSPRQLHHQGLFDDIMKLVKEHKIEAQSLQLEITEGVLMSRNPGIDKMLEKIHAADLKIAMDDFGTGYSSLSYLRNYPFDSLKIDRSFVSDIQKNSNDRALVQATLNMSHALGIKVVAEGIETNEQLEFLVQAGCEYGQGYLFSKPISAEAFETLLIQCQSLKMTDLVTS